jgi:sulfoxide reductase catalytic subunit YedY
MVVPWLGFSLADLIKRFEPKSEAKYIEFVTLVDKEQMPNQRIAL